MSNDFFSIIIDDPLKKAPGENESTCQISRHNIHRHNCNTHFKVVKMKAMAFGKKSWPPMKSVQGRLCYGKNTAGT